MNTVGFVDPWPGGRPALTRFLASGMAATARGPRPKPDHPLALVELHEALAEHRIHTRYQPIVRIADNRPVGFEVLARLEHPTRGLLPPDLFVPQIEDAGLAWPLTEAVIRRAFHDWGGGRLEAMDVWIAINFPLDVLLDPAALAWLEQARATAGIAARRLTIELTESRPVSRLAELRHATERLREIGYRLSIDDVGPDIRDHRQLLNMPFSSLKLDKDLVRESPDSASSREFLQEAVTAAHAAGLLIIAEGVEDTDIWNRMALLGVHEAQGFLIARPLPAEAVAGWFAEWCSRHHLSTSARMAG